MRQRSIIIPDKLFHKLWDISINNQFNSEYEYLTYIRENIKIKKHNIDLVILFDIAAKIYKLSGLTFKEILDQANIKQMTISDTFCVPIKTIMNWYAGKRDCPAYIRLMILKQYHLLNLGKYVHLQSEINYFKTIPNVYEKHEKKSVTDMSDEEFLKTLNKGSDKKYTEDDLYEEKPVYRSEDDREFFRKYGFFPPQTENASTDVDNLLDSLSYLNDVLFRKK